MRIVAGTARGRRLAAPEGEETRPTSDKVRAAVFNVLGQFFEGGRVLDLYAGFAPMARACRIEGRQYVGAEIEPARHAEALCRLAAVRDNSMDCVDNRGF